MRRRPGRSLCENGRAALVLADEAAYTGATFLNCWRGRAERPDGGTGVPEPAALSQRISTKQAEFSS
eukprot:6618250-Prymnesium_polylepis.2